MTCNVQEEGRQELLRVTLQLTEVQLQDIARVCNRYPDIILDYRIAAEGAKPVPVEEAFHSVPANSTVAIQVELNRNQAGDLRPVDAPRYYKISVVDHYTILYSGMHSSSR